MSAPPVDTSWPPGSGEMAARVRAFDWAAAPLGPVACWPRNMACAVELMLAMAQPACIGWGPQAHLLYNDAYARVLGPRHPAALGRPVVEVWEEAADALRPLIAGVMGGVPQRIEDGEFQLERRGGVTAPAWFTFALAPLRDAAGEVGGFFVTSTETTARVVAERRLRRSEARQRVLIGGVPLFVWRAVGGGAWTWSSPQWQVFTGQGQEESRGLGWLEVLHPDDRAAAMAAWGEAEGSGRFEVEYRVLHRDEGRHRWVQTRAAPVRDEGGHILEWLGTSTDIDDLRRLQDTQAVLVAELQHRTRNLIAVVRSIAGQTMDSSDGMEAFRGVFNDRLSALSRVQGLLSRADETPVTVEALIRMELDALGALDGAGERVRLAGPPVRLRNSMVQTLALAVHELATNALKYGALATETGRLEVTWAVREVEGEGRRVLLEWAEQGIDLALEERSPATGGYGRELIERALPYTLKARTRYELGRDGVRCTIDLPLERRERGGER